MTQTDKEFMASIEGLSQDTKLRLIMQRIDDAEDEKDAALIREGDAHFVEYVKAGIKDTPQFIYTTDKVMLTRPGPYRTWRVVSNGEAAYNHATMMLVRAGFARTRKCDVKFTMEDREKMADGETPTRLIRRVFRQVGD